jgi:hypothetical protein
VFVNTEKSIENAGQTARCLDSPTLMKASMALPGTVGVFIA